MHLNSLIDPSVVSKLLIAPGMKRVAEVYLVRYIHQNHVVGTGGILVAVGSHTVLAETGICYNHRILRHIQTCYLYILPLEAALP
jgi:hypothetical protein